MSALPSSYLEPTGLRTLIVGAGEAGRALCRDLQRVSSFGLCRWASSTTRRARSDRRGYPPCLGSLADLDLVLASRTVDVVVIAIPSLSRDRVRELGLRAAAHGVTLRHLPPFLAALQREIVGTDMRALQIGSLIGRSEMHVVQPPPLRCSPASACWSPAPAVPSAASCAARSGGSGPSSW